VRLTPAGQIAVDPIAVFDLVPGPGEGLPMRPLGSILVGLALGRVYQDGQV
jgi:hypothetical protein